MFWPHLPSPSFPQPPTPLTNPWNFPEWKKCSTNDVSGVGAGALNGRRAIKEPLISSSVNCYQLLSWLPPTRFLEHYCRHQDQHSLLPLFPLPANTTHFWRCTCVTTATPKVDTNCPIHSSAGTHRPLLVRSTTAAFRIFWVHTEKILV